MELTYEQWKESSQMLLFSAEELTGGAFGNSFQSLTLSVSFEVYRDCADTKRTPTDYLIAASSARYNDKGQDIPRSIIGRLIAMEPELVSISEGAVSVEQVKLSQAELAGQLMGGSTEIADETNLDELAR